MPALGEALREARSHARLTAAEAAREAGLSEEELLRLEAGDAVPGPELIERFSRLYPIDGRDLAGAVRAELLRRRRETARSVTRESLSAAERKGLYFSIGHLSDTLLEALQDPDFHARIERLARDRKPDASASAPEEETPGYGESADGTSRHGEA
jgi:transcriptional regulator with XRE-family HTH domain